MSESDNEHEMEVERERLERLANLDLADCPDELKISVESYCRDSGVHYDNPVTRCVGETKEDAADDWQFCREILILVQWIAEGKYRYRPSSSNGRMLVRFYRKYLLENDKVKESNHLPAQLRLSTYDAAGSRGDCVSLFVKVEQKLAGETVWKTDKELGPHQAFTMLESRAYRMDAADVLDNVRVFRRLY